MIKYFTADWCTPCQNFKKGLEEGDLDGVQVYNIDHHPDEVIDHRIQTVPTFIKCDENGKEIDRVRGTMSRAQFLSFKDE